MAIPWTCNKSCDWGLKLCKIKKNQDIDLEMCGHGTWVFPGHWRINSKCFFFIFNCGTQKEAIWNSPVCGSIWFFHMSRSWYVCRVWRNDTAARWMGAPRFGAERVHWRCLTHHFIIINFADGSQKEVDTNNRRTIAFQKIKNNGFFSVWI